MGVLQPIGTRPPLWLLLATIAGGMCLATTAPAPADQPGAEPAYLTPQDSGQTPVRPSAVIDVAIQPDGILRGRIVDIQKGIPVAAQAGLPICFLSGQRVVARACCDSLGQFSVANLAGGVYEVVVEYPSMPRRCLCRVWSPNGAPPQASSELTLVLEPVVIRGRPSGLWITTPPGFLVTALTAGAIAGPIIYHNTRRDNRVPLSP